VHVDSAGRGIVYRSDPPIPPWFDAQARLIRRTAGAPDRRTPAGPYPGRRTRAGAPPDAPEDRSAGPPERRTTGPPAAGRRTVGTAGAPERRRRGAAGAREPPERRDAGERRSKRERPAAGVPGGPSRRAGWS